MFSCHRLVCHLEQSIFFCNLDSLSSPLLIQDFSVFSIHFTAAKRKIMSPQKFKEWRQSIISYYQIPFCTKLLFIHPKTWHCLDIIYSDTICLLLFFGRVLWFSETMFFDMCLSKDDLIQKSVVYRTIAIFIKQAIW